MWDATLAFIKRLLVDPQAAATVLVGLFTLLVALCNGIWAFYRHIADRSGMGRHRVPLKQHFAAAGFLDVRQRFCDELRDYLDNLERQSNVSRRWHDSHFVPPDAEVLICREGRHEPERVSKLLAALRKLRGKRLFVVLGEPGAGKSLALRKLCRDLLDEVGRTGKVPIYINLRSWETSPRVIDTATGPCLSGGADDDGPPFAQRLPTAADLLAFIRTELKAQAPLNGAEFLERPIDPDTSGGDTCFDLMLKYGRFFIILDSFDEIPAVLDADDGDATIRHLAKVIANVVAGGNGGRGIVASRDFRRPRFSDADSGAKPVVTDDDAALLRVRPFRDTQIVAAIQQSKIDNPDAMARELFSKRPDLAAIARNPFSLALLIDYWREHAGRAPQTQAQLYESFIQRSLAGGDAALERQRRNLPPDVVIRCAEAIAERMYDRSGSGRTLHPSLEIEIAHLQQLLPDQPVGDAIAVLSGARIGRASDRGVFTFIHRRFQEYFYLARLRADPDRVPLEQIPLERSNWESLVLFAEVADEACARRIAGFCWEEIERADAAGALPGSPEYARALHCIRFLASAFRARRDVLADLEPVLAERVLKRAAGPDIRLAKHATEAAGLLSDDNAEKVVCQALARRDDWLFETALDACRYLPKPARQTKLLILDHLLMMTDRELLNRCRDFVRVLALSDGLRSVTYRLRISAYELQACAFLSSIAIPISLIGDNLYSIITAMLIVVGNLIYLLYEATKLKQSISKYFMMMFCLVFAWDVSDHIGIYAFILSLAITSVRPFRIMFILTPKIEQFLMAVCAASMRTRLKRIAGIVIFLSALYAMGMIGKFVSNHIQTDRVLIFGFVWQEFVGFMSIACCFIWCVYENMRDLREVQSGMRTFNGCRAQVAETFTAISSSRARLKFVRHLERESRKHESILASPGNQWPGGWPPNLGDKASTELAKLDLRWWGSD